MGKTSILSEEQKLIISKISENELLRSHFYFTGGTALSEVYLKHRESFDLDFFSQEKFDNQLILTIFTEWSKQMDFKIKPQLADPTYICELKFNSGNQVKVDFAYYPYKQLEKSTVYGNLTVDSLFDIAVNKFLLISQRAEIKDFVDLYFLLKKFSFWDLHEGVRAKFRVEIEPFIFASDLLAVEDYDFLPRMLKPLSLEKLKKFFRDQAKKLGKNYC